MTVAAAIAALAALVTLGVIWRAGVAPAPAQRPDAQRRAAQAQRAALEPAGAMDPADAMLPHAREQERAALDAELRDAPDLPAPTDTARTAPRLGVVPALVLAVLVGAATAGLYLYQQGPFWQAVAATRAPQAAPEILAMVGRLEQRLHTSEGSAQDWARLARSYAVLGRIRDAQQAYARAAALDPDDVLILDGYAQLGTPPPHPPAIAALGERARAGVQAAPADPRAWARLAFTRARLGDATGARDAYARAYELDPRPELLAAYAAAEYGLSPQQPTAQALALYERVLAGDADNPVALWVLGLAALQQQDQARAARLLDHLLELLPQDAPMRAVVEETARRAHAPS